MDKKEIVAIIKNGGATLDKHGEAVNEILRRIAHEEGSYSVNLGELLAVEMPKADAKILIKASMWAGYGEKKFNRFLTEKNKKRYPEIYETVKKAIPLLKKYS